MTAKNTGSAFMSYLAPFPNYCGICVSVKLSLLINVPLFGSEFWTAKFSSKLGNHHVVRCITYFDIQGRPKTDCFLTVCNSRIC